LTITDLDRSVAWYEDLLGMTTVFGDDNDDVRFRVMVHPTGWVLGLRQYHGQPKDAFDEFRCGLDHFAFGVADRAELDRWVEVLDEKGITYSPVAETPLGSVVVFRDPDNIQLEFWANP
jgi:catechol 2,3-dioxygenase-like lactoylglutathione lyase family enzyme